MQHTIYKLLKSLLKMLKSNVSRGTTIYCENKCIVHNFLKKVPCVSRETFRFVLIYSNALVYNYTVLYNI